MYTTKARTTRPPQMVNPAFSSFFNLLGLPTSCNVFVQDNILQETISEEDYYEYYKDPSSRCQHGQCCALSLGVSTLGPSRLQRQAASSHYPAASTC